MVVLRPRQLAVHLSGWRDPTAGAAYAALADRIRLLLLDGRIAAATRMPAERELAAELGVSRTTVAAAYARLRELGYLASVRGSGSVARIPMSAELGAPEPAEGVLDFSKATLPTWPGVADAAARAVERLPAYLGGTGFDPVGLPELRSAIADHYAARGLPTDPDQIVVTLGAQHAIALVARTVLTRGDRVLVESPSYPHAYDALREAGGRLVTVAVTADDGDAGGWDAEGLEQALGRTGPALAYLMPDSHNPTGRSMPEEQRRRIAELAHRVGTVVIVDETMRGLELRGGGHPPFATHGGDTVTIGSVGKSVWGGIRIGWIRSSVEFARRAVRTRFSGDLGTPLLEQLIVADLLPGLESILEARRATLRENRDHVVAELRRRMPDWQVPLPDGGLTTWVHLGRPLSSQLALQARAEGLLIASGQRFGIDGAFERHLRVPFSLRRADLDAGIDVLERAWAAVLRRPLPAGEEQFAQIA